MSLSDDLARADRETLKEIIRNAESHLGAQLTAGLASNQRAMTFTSLIGAATVVLGGTAGSLIIGQNPRVALGIVCAAVAAGFLASMALAIRAAKPTDFWFAGNTPTAWAEDVRDGKSFERSLAEQAAWYAEMITDNAECSARADRLLLAAMRTAWTSLALGAFAAGAVLGVPVLVD